MKRIVFVCMIVFLFAACGKKKDSNIIIVQKPKAVQAPPKKEKMEEVDYNRTIDWVGSTYSVYIHRVADESLPMVEDEYGNRYYDNRIAIKVLRKDGSEFFNRTFTKSDFNSCLDDNFRKNGALLGLVFVEAKDDDLKFAGSVGSPDQLSDEYIPVVMWLNRMGTIRVSRDTELDGSVPVSNNVENQEDEEGV